MISYIILMQNILNIRISVFRKFFHLIMFVRRVDEDHSSHLGVVGAGSGECADG